MYGKITVKLLCGGWDFIYVCINFICLNNTLSMYQARTIERQFIDKLTIV